MYNHILVERCEVWVHFSLPVLFVSPVFIQAPAYFTNSTVSPSSVELSHFLSNIICDRMVDYKYAAMIWRDGQGRVRYGITVFPVQIARP